MYCLKDVDIEFWDHKNNLLVPEFKGDLSFGLKNLSVTKQKIEGKIESYLDEEVFWFLDFHKNNLMKMTCYYFVDNSEILFNNTILTELTFNQLSFTNSKTDTKFININFKAHSFISLLGGIH